MSKRLTAQEQLDRHAQKMADMGITVSISRNPSGIPNPVMDELESALERAGISKGRPAMTDDYKAEAVRIDHGAESRLALEYAMRDVSANWPTNTGEFKSDVIAQAQVHATLALVDAVDRLTASFGQCDHGYTICPYCIRNGIQGVGL